MKLRFHLQAFFLLVTLPALAARVAWVDNTKPAGGDGSQAQPYSTLEGAVGSGAEFVYVLQTNLPYVESVTLRKGQALVGSAYGLDTLAAEMKTSLGVSAPAQNGTGPLIRGNIVVTGDNVVAGCTMIVDRTVGSGITAGAVDGRLSIRGMTFQTSSRSFAITLQQQHGPVSISGGGVVAAADGSGLLITGGDGEITVDRFPMTGNFGTAVRIFDRTGGAVTFRNGSAIHVDDASDDAVVVLNTAAKAPVTFADRLQIKAHRRGLVASGAGKLVVSGSDSWLASTGGTALDLRESAVDVVLDSVSSDGAAEGVVVDKVRGRLEVRGIPGQPASGGTIHAAKTYGLRVTQSSNVRFANMTISASGSLPSAAPATAADGRRTAGRQSATRPQARCAGEFDVNTTAPCNAALYLRHLEGGSFEHILIDGGGAMGLNANNVKDVKFDNVEIRSAGDESFEAGALLQEVNGSLRFTLCRFADNAGSEVLIEQKFNHGRVTFDRCRFEAAARPLIADTLIGIHVLLSGALGVEVTGSELHDNAGSGVAATASGTSALSLSIADTFVQHLGTGGVTLRATDSAHASLAMARVQIAAPAAPVVIDAAAAGSAALCTDFQASAFTGGKPPIRLAATGPQASLQVVTGATGAAAIANAISAANGGAFAAIEASGTALAAVGACR